MKTQKR